MVTAGFMAAIPLCLLIIKLRLIEPNTQLCCVRRNKCSLFSNKYKGMAAIMVNIFRSNVQSTQETCRVPQVTRATEGRKHCRPVYDTDNPRTTNVPRTPLRTCRSLNATVTQPKNCPFGVNIRMEL